MTQVSRSETTQRAIAAVSAQVRHYAKNQKREKLGLTVPDAFVRGIRHLGYRSNVEAIAELVDNAIQAYAEHIDIVFGYENGASQKKPAQVAVLDDGHGMASDMIQLAMMWGGTHRENDRSGLGRYGYGLPCSTMSIGRRFTVISKVSGGLAKQVTLDLDDLNNGKYNDDDGDAIIPSPCDAKIPDFIMDNINRYYPNGWKSGTIVLIEKLDRLDSATTAGFANRLKRQFSVTYHKFLASTKIFIDGDKVYPTDPLFLNQSELLYQIDDDRAFELEPVQFEVAKSGGFGKIFLRYSYLPPSFASIDKNRDAVGLNANERFPVLKKYHGIIFSRNGRLIDCKTKTPWTTFINNDRYIRIEVEFPASLDELFGVTTAKQQISVSPEMWDRLREAGLVKAIEQLRNRVRSLKSERARGPAIAPILKHSNPRGLIGRSRPTLQPDTEHKCDRPILLLRKSSGALGINLAHPAFGGGGRPKPNALQDALEALLHALDASGRERSAARRRILSEILSDWSQSLDADLPSIARILFP